MEPIAIRTAKKTIYVYQMGENNRNITLVLSRPLPREMTMITDAFMIVEDGILETFREWMAGNLVADTAKELKTSRAKIGRARKALGIQKYRKSGTSKTTIWRKRKAAEKEG